MPTYAIVADRPSAETGDRITKGLKAKATDVGWWHWFKDAWILVDPQGRGCAWWRDQVKELAPEANFYVFELTGKFSGWSAKQHHEWLVKHLQSQ